MGRTAAAASAEFAVRGRKCCGSVAKSLESTGFQIRIPYLILGCESHVLAMGNVKPLRSIRHDQNYDLIV